MNTSHRSSSADRDFGKACPSQDQRGTVFYNTGHRREDRDGRDSDRDNPNNLRSTWDNRDNRDNASSTRNNRDCDQDRDRKLKDLQRELDLLKRR